MNKFCANQTKCEEDTEETFTCVGYLAEGRALQCPYKSIEEAKSGIYPCLEAEPEETNGKKAFHEG